VRASGWPARSTEPVRLYLSSFRLGEHPEHLVRLVGAGARVAAISNAVDPVDAHTEGGRREAVRAELEALGRLGLAADELDLRDHVDDPAGVRRALEPYAGVWLRGGNAFMLRAVMRRSGADTVLVDLVRQDTLVYAGYSAGPCVLAPSLRGLEYCDDPGAVERAYGLPPVWDGLGLIDYAFVPHVDSPGHPETEQMAVVTEHYRRDGVPHRTLRDGQALVVEGGVTILV
jgi:dipeptidase E